MRNLKDFQIYKRRAVDFDKELQKAQG